MVFPKNRDLFEFEKGKCHVPLAARMRPRTLDEFVGQKHILGPGRLLRRAIQADQISSLIFYGPPGSGKTTLARIIARTTKADFASMNAVLSGVKDIRESIAEAQKVRRVGMRFVLFIDEVHRFNKAQQDALLPHVENGTVILIGATTENPYFEVNKALISRSRIFAFNNLTKEDLSGLVDQCLFDSERGYGKRDVTLTSEAREHLIQMANGDARALLNALELAVETTQAGNISLEDAEESIQQKAVLYDKDGDAHYDTISAFIKSLRGSDPDASLYWLAKMVYAGEDPRFIFRRMLILASEDVGLADPNAVQVVQSCAQAYDYVGLPEGQFHMAQACLYLATAPKSNSTMAYFDALGFVQKSEQDDVPNHLKDPSRDRYSMGHGQGYAYPHAYQEHWVAQKYLPESLQNKVFFKPSTQGQEKNIKEEVESKRELQYMAQKIQSHSSIHVMDIDWVKGDKSKKLDKWLHRSLVQTEGMYQQVRDQLFQYLSEAGVSSEGMVLDLSGDLGFLTWEACRRFPQGGVWSLCSSEKNKQTLEGWVQHFEYFIRPYVVCKVPKEESILFNGVVGYNLLGSSEDLEKTIMKVQSKLNLLEKKGSFVFAERDASQGPDLVQLLQSILKKNTGSMPSNLNPAWENLLESLQTLQNQWRQEQTEQLEKQNKIIEDVFKSDSQKYSIKKKSHRFHFPRTLDRTQLQNWLKSLESQEEIESTSLNQGSSLLVRLKEKWGEEKQWTLFKESFLSLANHPLQWEQGYYFWIGKKG